MVTPKPAPGVIELGTITDPADADFDCPGCNATTTKFEVFLPMVHVQIQHERGCSWLRRQARR